MTTQERIKEWKLHPSQRGSFAFELYKQMAEDESIWLICMDLGYGVFSAHFEDFPKRCINTGAAEAAGLGIAVGLALERKKPFCYTITSFFLRAAETISLYLAHENIAVRLVGSGRDNDYAHDGYSHDAVEAQDFIRRLGLMEFYPENKEQIPNMVKKMLELDNPSFISLRR